MQPTDPIRALCAELHQALAQRADTMEEERLLDRSAAALRAALSEPADGPAAEGEVAELVAALREEAAAYVQLKTYRKWQLKLARAAELLERQAAPVPVAVAERLPKPNTKVIAHYFNDHGKGRTICAIWVPANSRECTGDDSISEPDAGCWPEGWYEQIENWEDYGWIAVSEGEVAYWQPLPKWPTTALPLPAQAGEVQPDA